jgi:hypothetical protein
MAHKSGEKCERDQLKLIEVQCSSNYSIHFFQKNFDSIRMGITASRDDLCSRDLSQRRKIEELQYRVIEYQREADHVIECAGELVNRIEKLLSSGQKMRLQGEG